MSCVSSLVHENKVYMGSDGLVSGEDGNIRHLKNKKILFNKGYLFGIVGSAVPINLLDKDNFSPNKNLKNTVQSIIEILQNSYCMFTGEDGSQQCGSLITIGYQGKIYQLHGDFFLSEYADTYNASGSGLEFALGSLYTTHKTKKKPHIRIIESIQCSSYFRGDVGGKITVICEDGREWTVN